MADKHPYVPSLGGLSKTITHFRKSFPASVNAVTLKKLGFAPNNESYVMNVLRFLNLIDSDDKKSDVGATIFSNHDDAVFAKALGAQVQDSYSALFDLHGEKSWNLDKDALMSFFRTSDQTTEIVGRRQATTFQLLAKFADHADSPRPKSPEPDPKTRTVAAKQRRRVAPPRATSNDNAIEPHEDAPKPAPSRVGLTVRIEINLPADGDQDTYDRIFKSIRENFLND